MKNNRLAFLMAVLILSSACGPAWGPRISIHWKSFKPEVMQKTPLKYQTITIGLVEKVEGEGWGTTAHARLYRKYAHYVRENTTFLVKKDPADNSIFIDVRPLKRDAPAARDGAVFSGSESDLEAGVRTLVTDWKRTAILAGAAVVVILLLLFLFKLFFKLWALILCLAGGAASAYYLSHWVDQRLQMMLPAEVRSDLVAYVVAFLGGFIVANIIVGILFRPMKSKR